MIVYIDENFPAQLARGLDVLQKPLNDGSFVMEVRSIKDTWPGARYEDWIPKAGQEEAIVITQDLRIQTTRHQRDLYQQYGLGIFFFKPPSKYGYSYWEMVRQIIFRWEEIKKMIHKNKRPFAFRCTQRKGFERLD